MNGLGPRALVVGADAERLGRLAGPLVREAERVSLEFCTASGEALEQPPVPAVDCVACEVPPGVPPGERLASLREAAPSVPVVLFAAEAGTGLEPVEGVADAVVVGRDGEGARRLLRSVEAAVEDDHRPERSAAWYETLLGVASDVVFVLDAEGTVEYVSPSVRRLLGYEPGRLVGDPVTEYVAEGDLDADAERLLAFADDGRGRSTAEFGLERADGRTCVVEAAVHGVPESGPVGGCVVTVRDVTEARHREDLVEYERIVETVPIGLIALDADGRIAWTNDVYAETLEVPREELVETPFVDLVEAGYYEETIVEDYLDNVRRLLSSSTDADRASYVVRTHLPDGETVLHDVHTALLPMPDGEFEGTVHAFRDVTTQREYERELERQNERLESFASVVSHDLRNPLSVAEAYLEMAMETGDRDALETVANAHGRMNALVDDLLTLARDGRTVEDPTPTDLAAVARRAWAAVETGTATLDVEDDGTVLADPARLQQSLENLFRNSMEHGSTSSGLGPDDAVEPCSTGNRAEPDDAVEREARTRNGEEDESEGGGEPDLTVTVGPLEDGTGFFVADDGRGIPADEREYVFERGYTTDPGGTGFGLTIVESIAEAHGWSVSVVGDESGGARFEVTGVEYVD